MSNLMIFENKSVEVFEFNGNILFNPKHVAECLDIKNVNDAIANFNEKQKIKLRNLDIANTDIRKLNNAGENFLTESGVYKLIFKSRKEEAEKFQDWVTDEVLPSIRANGGYNIKGLSKELQAILLVDKKQQELDTRITSIEDKMTVNYELAENLRIAINRRAIELLGGKDSIAYKKINKKLYAAFYRDIKRTFKVNSYKNLSVKNYELAMNFIEGWEPKDEVLNYAIHGLNSQIAFA